MANRCGLTIQKMLVVLGLITLLSAPVVLADSYEKPDFWRVGRMYQYHSDSSKIGYGTCTLISPNWVLTAYHVVKFKDNNPDGGSLKIIFKANKVEGYVGDIYKAPGIDVALCKLKTSIGASKLDPIALMDGKFTNTNDGMITFTMVGRQGGLHYHRNRKGHGIDGGDSFYHSADSNGSRPGKAGDSGGAFLLERYCDYPDVQFSVIHGGGYGPQVGPLKD